MMMDKMPKMMPSFSMDQEMMPEMKDWSVGKKYKMEVEVEMTGMNKDEYMKGSPMMGRFKVMKAHSMDKSVKDMSKSEYKKLYVKARSGS